MRGFVRELISIVTWVAAIWLAVTYSDQVSLLLPEAINSANLPPEGNDYVTNLRVTVAFVLIFVGTLIFGMLVNFVLGQIMKAQILKGLDRVLGMLFGLARACVIITILVLAAGALTSLPSSSTWHKTKLIKPFETAAIWVVGQLPDHLAQHFNFPSAAPSIELEL